MSFIIPLFAQMLLYLRTFSQCWINKGILILHMGRTHFPTIAKEIFHFFLFLWEEMWSRVEKCRGKCYKKKEGRTTRRTPVTSSLNDIEGGNAEHVDSQSVMVSKDLD